MLADTFLSGPGSMTAYAASLIRERKLGGLWIDYTGVLFGFNNTDEYDIKPPRLYFLYEELC